MRRQIILLLILTVLLVMSCNLSIFGSPEFTNYPAPDLTVDFSAFESADESVFKDLGCDEIRPARDLMGGLEPSYPIARCVVLPLADGDYEAVDRIREEGSYVYASGGLFPEFTRYVIQREGQFEVLRTIEDFQPVFSPVQNENEALSFALAVRRLSAYFGLEREMGLEYFVDSLADTHVEQTPDGFLINLYSYELFGCGPHLTHQVDVLVTEDGRVEDIESEPVFKDPAEDDLCVD